MPWTCPIRWSSSWDGTPQQQQQPQQQPQQQIEQQIQQQQQQIQQQQQTQRDAMELSQRRPLPQEYRTKLWDHYQLPPLLAVPIYDVQ